MADPYVRTVGEVDGLTAPPSAAETKDQEKRQQVAAARSATTTEIQAMNGAWIALQPLDAAQLSRAWEWLHERLWADLEASQREQKARMEASDG